MKSKHRNISKQIIYSIIFAVIVYMILAVWGASGGLRQSFSKFDWYLFPLLLTLAFSNYVIRFIKWQYYLKILNINIPRKESFQIHMSGLALSITPGKLGEVIKSYFLKNGYNEPISKTAPIVFADRLTDLMSLVFLVSVGAYGFSYGQKFIWGIALLIFVVFLVVIIRPLGQGIINIFKNTKFISKKADKLQTFYNSSRVLLEPKRIILPLIVSIFAWSMEALAFYFVFIGFGLEKSFLSASFVYSFSTIVGAVSMLPGGLGTTEGAITGLMKLMSIDSGTAVLATLIIRAATLWFAVIIGLFFLVAVERRVKVRLDEIKE